MANPEDMWQWTALDIVLHGFRQNGFASQDLDYPVISAAEKVVRGERERWVLKLRYLKNWLPTVIRNTPHSCHTEEHCCSLHAAHKAAAERVEEILQAEIDKLEGNYVEPPAEKKQFLHGPL